MPAVFLSPYVVCTALLTPHRYMIGANGARGRSRENTCDTTAIYQSAHLVVFRITKLGPLKLTLLLHCTYTPERSEYALISGTYPRSHCQAHTHLQVITFLYRGILDPQSLGPPYPEVIVMKSISPHTLSTRLQMSNFHHSSQIRHCTSPKVLSRVLILMAEAGS